jgi:uncharacterized protein (DUF305 family)
MTAKALVLAFVVATIPAAASANHDPEQAKDAMLEAHHKMMTEMESLQPTGEADRDFVSMMIPHHQGAIDAAKVELEYGHDETLRAMAEAIIEAQEKEIAEMKAWLEANPQ